MFTGDMLYRVLVTCPQMQRTIELYRERFEQAGISVELPNVVQQLSEDQLVTMIDRYDGMIAGDDPVTARVIDNARRLRVIAKWGVGVDNIDVAAAHARGIQVRNTPGTFGGEVADVVIGYLVMLARLLHKTDAGVREGRWPKIQGRSLAGKTLGIVGLGSIGFSVARRALAMEMDVVGYDVAPTSVERAQTIGACVVPLEDLLQRSDYLALCCPLTPDTHHLLNRNTLQHLKQGASIINTARGGLIDEAALVKALQQGRIRSAALDVFETEPLPPESPLRHFEQVILGAHNSSNTLEGTLRVNDLTINNLLDGLGIELSEKGVSADV